MDNDTGVIYRNYNNNLDINKLIEIRDYCHQKKIKIFLSNYFKIAIKLKLDGVYMPSFNKNFRHLNFKLRSTFSVLGSAHNIKEIRIKEKQKVKLIFISSIFKKNKNYLGIYKFRILKQKTKKKVVALGGVSSQNKKKIKLLDCYGFSGISYFE